MNNININSKININNTSSKSVELKMEEKVVDYLKSSGIAPSNDLSKGINQLKNNQLTVKDFCKNILNSTNSNDIKAVANIAQTLNVSVILDKPISNKTVATGNSPLPSSTQLANKEISQNATFMNNISIVHTLPKDQVIAGKISQMLLGGKGKEAFNLCENKAETVMNTLDTLPKNLAFSSSQIQSVLVFTNSAMNSVLANNPVVMEKLKKEYDKFKKMLDELEELDGDLSTLSPEAADFLDSLQDLMKKMKNWEGDKPKDLEESFNELMGVLEMAEN